MLFFIENNFDNYLNPSWRTSLVIDELIAMPICIADIIAEIEPLTNDLNYLLLDDIRKIHCGENSFPFLFVDKNTIVAAVSYPFLDEGNCKFLILATGLHIWENVEHPYNGYLNLQLIFFMPQ